MSTKEDKLVEALERNTASNHSLSNSINDLVVVMDLVAEFDESEAEGSRPISFPGNNRTDN